jgi:ABC-type lipoprotein release transport system permease subunit
MVVFSGIAIFYCLRPAAAIEKEKKMGKFIKLAWRNMWRNWRRTVIAVTAIVLGLILLVFMAGTIEGSDQAIFGNMVRLYGGNLQIHAAGYGEKANNLPMLPVENDANVVETVLAHPNVTAVARRINTGGMVSSREGTFPVIITGIDPDAETEISIVSENIQSGRYLMTGETDAILIGKGLADLLDVGVSDTITLVGRRKNEEMRQRTVTIVGIYSLGLTEAEKGSVFITLTEAQTLYNMREQVTEVSIILESVGQEADVKADLTAALPGYEIDAWDTLQPEMRQIMDVKAQVTEAFSLIVLLIASVGVLNLMLMAVFERTREMGVLAALGMKSGQLMGLFLLEGAMIGVIGAIVGSLLGWLAVQATATNGINFVQDAEGLGDMVALMGNTIYPTISLGFILGRGAAVAVIATLASLYPAWQASRQEPADALHYV